MSIDQKSNVGMLSAVTCDSYVDAGTHAHTDAHAHLLHVKAATSQQASCGAPEQTNTVIPTRTVELGFTVEALMNRTPLSIPDSAPSVQEHIPTPFTSRNRYT